jgi:hypothetical protein
MSSQRNPSIAWFKWPLYLLGATLAISGCFLPWWYWQRGEVTAAFGSTPGLSIDFGHKPLLADHGGLVIVLLSAATVVIAVSARRYDKCPGELVLATSAPLALIATYYALNAQALPMPVGIGGGAIWPGEGLNKVLAGSLLVFFSAALDHHFTRPRRFSEEASTGASDQKACRFGWASWLWWVLASAIGLVVGACASRNLASSYLARHWNRGVLLASHGFALGASVGMLQWLVLRRRVARAGWWIPASAAGWMVSRSACSAVTRNVSIYRLVRPDGLESLIWYTSFLRRLEGLGSSLPLVVFVAAGASAGVLQWLILRRESSLSGWWIVASTLGWAAIGVIWTLILGDLRGATCVSGALGGAVTGLALIWLFRHPTP